MLVTILEYKRGEVASKASRQSLLFLRALAEQARAPRNLASALRAPGVSLIAEVKLRSPSKGILRANADPVDLAQVYTRNGTRAVSVLADTHFFGGGAHVVEQVANAVGIRVPILFKDFVFDQYQIYEARSVSADAVLLIVRSMDLHRLTDLLALVHALEMHALVEVFTEAEAEQALAAGARIIGVNNRDLETFQVDLERSARVRAVISNEALTVSESGLRSRTDVLAIEHLGFDGMLVGEALVRASNVGLRVRQFLGLQPENNVL